jgi:hypothetical protein
MNVMPPTLGEKIEALEARVLKLEGQVEILIRSDIIQGIKYSIPALILGVLGGTIPMVVALIIKK